MAESYPTSPSTDRIELHQVTIAENFHAGVQPLLRNEPGAIDLRPYQPPVVQDLDDFMVETKYELNRAILIPEAGNFGKSFMSIVSMDLAGVGRPVPETGDKIRGLFLTSRNIGIKQALETYQQITPDLKVEVFSQDIDPKLLPDTDVYVLTYNAAASMPEAAWQQLVDGRDLLAIDEAHRAIGPKIAARLLMAREVQQPTILASTATPRFNNLHTVADVLGIDKSTTGATPCDAIYVGAANEAKLIALSGGEQVELTGLPDMSIHAKDLRQLAHSVARNELILDVMADMAEAAGRGLSNSRPVVIPNMHEIWRDGHEDKMLKSMNHRPGLSPTRLLAKNATCASGRSAASSRMAPICTT